MATSTSSGIVLPDSNDNVKKETELANLQIISGKITEFDAHKAESATNAHLPQNVGLGNVQNYGISTQAEAEAGVATNKYMTPLRTKEAILAMGSGLQKQIFTGNGNFVAPKAGVYKVTVVGGGGSTGRAHASTYTYLSGGGGGGIAIKYVTLAKDASIAVTIGQGGQPSATEGSNGAAGGTSSFGAHCSATGGSGGTYTYNIGSSPFARGANGGQGSNGDLNLKGGQGGLVGNNVDSNHLTSLLEPYGKGADSFYGKGADSFYGKGADSFYGNAGNAFAGNNGVVIVEWI